MMIIWNRLFFLLIGSQAEVQNKESRESEKTVLHLKIIIIFINYIIIYYYNIINYGEPSQPKPETELQGRLVLSFDQRTKFIKTNGLF